MTEKQEKTACASLKEFFDRPIQTLIHDRQTNTFNEYVNKTTTDRPYFRERYDSKLGAEMIMVHEEGSILKVLGVLQEYQLLAVPVLSSSQRDLEGAHITGLVSILDLLRVTLLSPAFDDFGVWEEEAGGRFEEQLDEFLEKRGSIFQSKTVRDALLSKEYKEPRIFYRDEKLYDLLCHFVDKPTHRVIVMDREHHEDYRW